jgi:hypothetical protein
VVVLFFSVFFAIGAGVGGWFFGKPLLSILAARQWRSASCEIISSRVHTNRDSEGSTYRVDVTYRYFVNDQPYVGRRYKFSSMSTSGYRGKAAIVARLAPGTRTDCWINPADPADAVIERGPTADLWFGLIPLMFLLVGGAGMYGAATARGRFAALSSSKPTTRTATFTKTVHGAGAATLRPKYGRGTKLAGLIVIALFWNGIVSVFLYDLLPPSRRGGLNWFFALFLTPFVLIGLGLIAAAIHQALQLSNPRPTVTVNTAIVTLGTDLRVNWSIEGRVQRLARWSLTLEAREEVTYTRGTDSTTDTRVFATMPLANQLPPEIARAGSASVTIPADTMHSFEAANNKIVWLIRAHTEMRNWPDSNDEFPLIVAPRAL